MLRFWLVCHPDIDKPIGGVKQLHRLAECLVSLGFEAKLIQDDATFKPKWFLSKAEAVAFERFSKSATIHPDRDIFILPETYACAFLSYIPGFRKIIFNQNSSYTFYGAGKPLDPDLVRSYYANNEIIGVICVSDYDQRAILSLVSRQKPVLRIANAIDTDLFAPEGNKHKHLVYMPRKNAADSAIVASAIRCSSAFKGWKLEALQGLTSTEVAARFKKAAVFLSFGHPEGFGLPVAEALACGCAVVGYSGLGGRELFALGSCYGVAEELEFGDLMSFEPAFRRLNHQIDTNPADLAKRALKVSQIVRETYSFEQMRATLLQALCAMQLTERAHHPQVAAETATANASS